MIGWDAIGYLLEWASLLNWESGSLLVMIRELLTRLQMGSVSFRGDFGSGFCSCGLSKRLRTCALEAGLNTDNQESPSCVLKENSSPSCFRDLSMAPW